MRVDDKYLSINFQTNRRSRWRLISRKNFRNVTVSTIASQPELIRVILLAVVQRNIAPLTTGLATGHFKRVKSFCHFKDFGWWRHFPWRYCTNLPAFRMTSWTRDSNLNKCNSTADARRVEENLAVGGLTVSVGGMNVSIGEWTCQLGNERVNWGNERDSCAISLQIIKYYITVSTCEIFAM